MGCFTKEEKVVQDQPQIVELPDPMADYRSELAEAAKAPAQKRLALAGTTYQGPLTAALSEYEQQGLGTLGEYLKSAPATESPLYQASSDEILKTLQGTEYDPVNSDYYRAYRTQVIRELEDAKDRLAARASAGDKLFGGGRIKTEGEMEEGAVGNMAVLLGQMQERERERRLGAVPQALELTRYGEEAPVSRVTAAETLGALPRLVEQASMDAEYQEWIRALNDLGIGLDVATGLATYQPQSAVVPGQAIGGGLSDWGVILGALGSAGGAYAGAKAAG